MEILSYPIGLVIGLFPVIVDLNGQPGPARLLLDGRQVCEVSVRAPACMIDIGPDPRIRSLDLERLDAKGRVVERIRRWINRPAAEGKIRAVGSCDDKRGQCEFQLQWAHPSKLDPSSVTVSLDGKTVRKGDDPLVCFSFNPKRPPQVLTVEAVFPDGQRADFTQLLHGGSYPEKAGASLHPVPLEVAPGDAGHDLEARLRGAGWKVRAVDEGETEILFVLQPKAISRFAQATSEISRNPAMLGGSLEGLGPLWFIVADETLALMQPAVVGEHEKRWLPALITVSSRASLARIRTADAVAAGGYRLGGEPRRRIMVLVLGPRDFFEPDSSTLSSAQALEYLRQVGVPLVVWRVQVSSSGTPPPALANLAKEEWPEGEWIRTSHDFPRAIARLRDVIDRQRLVWLEEAADTSVLEPLLPAGVKLAGSAMSRDPAAETPPDHTEHPSVAPSRIVYAAAADPAEPQTIYAGTAEGLLRSGDAGATWTRLETGSAGGVFSLAFAGEGRARLLAGGSSALFRSVPAAPGWSGLSLPAVFALGVDPSNPSVLYAGTRGRVLKSTDGGLQWSDASSGVAATFALALAVSPKDSATVYAGTAGSGVFKSSDAGKTWHPSGAELQGTAVRSLAIRPDNSAVVYAGTDGGVFLSTDAGRFWKTAGTGLPRAITYALAIDPGNRERIFAGTASGLFVSEHGGSYWKRCPALKAPVASLAFDSGAGRLIAGTLGEGVVALSLADLETEPGEGAPADMPEQKPQGVPPGLLPATATGPELPLRVVLSNPRANQNRSKISALLRVTVRIEPILETMAKTGRARMLLNVVSESPAAARSSLTRVERSVPFEANVDNWTLEVPITWSSRATRLFVTIVEAGTGAHAVAAIDPAALE